MQLQKRGFEMRVDDKAGNGAKGPQILLATSSAAIRLRKRGFMISGTS